MNSKLKVVLSVAVLVIATTGAYSYGKSQVSFGADPGPVKTEAQEFRGGVAYGFVNATSSATDSLTLVAGDLFRQGAYYNTILFTKVGPAGGGTVASTTWTFPATSTMTTVLPGAGERTELCLVNSTTTGSALTIAEGSGWIFKTASSTVTATTAKDAVGGAVSRIIMGGHSLCGGIIRGRVFNDSAGFTDTGTSTTPGDLIFQFYPTADAQ